MRRYIEGYTGLHLTHRFVAQESSPGAGPAGQAAAGMFWQYGRDVAEQLQATRAAVAAAVQALRAPQSPASAAVTGTDHGALVSVRSVRAQCPQRPCVLASPRTCTDCDMSMTDDPPGRCMILTMTLTLNLWHTIMCRLPAILMSALWSTKHSLNCRSPQAIGSRRWRRRTARCGCGRSTCRGAAWTTSRRLIFVTSSTPSRG